MILSGRVWKIGDDISTTDLVSARYDKEGMNKQWDECAKHILEDIDPSIAPAIKKGDIIVAGENFGNGHAHYYGAAINGSWAAGVSALLAESINTLFLRAAIDAGVPAWPFKGLASFVENGDILEINFKTGEAKNLTSGSKMNFKPVSEIILDILAAGGSDNWALQRVK